MRGGIPLHVKASVAVARGNTWSGALAVKDLPRLAECVANPRGSLAVSLRAVAGAGEGPALRGSIAGALGLQCQSCLETFEWPLDAVVDLRLVAAEAEEQRLLRECEPYLVHDDHLPLRELVEDEALLALPLAPRCPACAAAGRPA